MRNILWAILALTLTGCGAELPVTGEVTSYTLFQHGCWHGFRVVPTALLSIVWEGAVPYDTRLSGSWMYNGGFGAGLLAFVWLVKPDGVQSPP